MVIHLDLGKDTELEFCKWCVDKKKQHYDVFSTKDCIQAIKFLKLFYFDVNGHIQTAFYEEKKYFFIYIDDFLKNSFVYFMNQKSEFMDKFIFFKALVEKNRLRDLDLEFEKVVNIYVRSLGDFISNMVLKDIFLYLICLNRMELQNARIGHCLRMQDACCNTKNF